MRTERSRRNPSGGVFVLREGALHPRLPTPTAGRLHTRMEAVPLHLKEANAFVARHHRHNLPTTGCKFALGAAQGGKLVGVAVAGRPVARRLDDGKTLEVLRVATDG